LHTLGSDDNERAFQTHRSPRATTRLTAGLAGAIAAEKRRFLPADNLPRPLQLQHPG
jgi:hypothetical protein